MLRQKRTYYILTIAILSMAILPSCSVKKFIPANEYLFRGAAVVIEDSASIKEKSALETELQSLIHLEPNSQILGVFPGLRYYYKAQKEKAGFISRFLNEKFGEEPVYFSDFRISQTKDVIENRLENSGFFKSKITSSFEKDSAKKTVKGTYNVVIGKPYSLNEYVLEEDSLDLLDAFPIYEQLENAMTETIIKEGSRYDLDLFKAERERIDQYLKKRGYYNFNSSFLIFQVDTNLGANKTYNLYLKLKVGVPSKSKVPYVLNHLKVYPNVASDVPDSNVNPVIFDGIAFIQKTTFFRPKRLRPFIVIKPGQLYNPVASKNTSRQLSSIGTYKFVNINYTELDSTFNDSLQLRYLDANISLSPLNRKSIQAELQAVTKSNNFTGPNVGLTYLNRNVFDGGENFSATASVGYEKQFGNNTNGSTSLQVALRTSLIFPRLISPFNFDRYLKNSTPKTKVIVAVENFRRREIYALNSYSSSFSYSWTDNKFLNHQLTPLKIDYLQLGNTSALFNSILDENSFLKRSFEQQLITGLTYSLFYSELSKAKKGRFNLKFNFELAGNALSMFGSQPDGDFAKTVLGLAYAQYGKGDIDLSYNYKLGPEGEALVGRVFAGIGIPYGNSQTLPFVKQYFSGGAYSVRAFQIRGMGPGVYDPVNEDNLYFDRSGDIRLEGNLEYRFPIYSYLKGALFLDAGNIWNLSDNLVGGKFTSDFTKQFGVGTGLGLRVDVQGFVIRSDFAAPLKRPVAGWSADFGNPVFNFAIGYPF
jgi:outer membrane protein insertion porin family